MKKWNVEPILLLKIFLGSVFLCAGIYRIFHWQNAMAELSLLHLHSAYAPIIIVLEIIGGLLLIFNIQSRKITLIFIIFLLIALAQALITSWQTLLSSLDPLFVFSPNATDFFLHVTYLTILLYLLFEDKNHRSS